MWLTYLTRFGLPLCLWTFSTCCLTNFSISSGVWCGTRRMENLPITLRGITVLAPAALKAPSIPERKKKDESNNS